MHIDIDLARIAVEEQNQRRVPPWRQIIHIGRAHRANQQFVADRPPVDEQILRLSIGFVPGRQTGITFEPEIFPHGLDGQRVGAEVFA